MSTSSIYQDVPQTHGPRSGKLLRNVSSLFLLLEESAFKVLSKSICHLHAPHGYFSFQYRLNAI